MRNKKFSFYIFTFVTAVLILSSLSKAYNFEFGALKMQAVNTFKSPVASAGKELANVTSLNILKESSGVIPAFKNLIGKILGSENKASARPLRKEVFGFLPFWTLDKKIHFRYELLSTIAYFGVDINSEGEFIKERDNGKTDGAWAGWISDDFTQVINQAKKYKTKILLTIKGFDNETIEKLLNCSKCRSNLVNGALKEIKNRKADGVNLDFEYVGTPDDDLVFRFTQLVKDFVDVFHDEIPGSYVSVSTYAKSAADKKLHDIKRLSSITDSFFIMGYDFFRPVSTYAGPVAPLGGAEKYGYDLKTTVADYLKLAPANKLILGLPYYGYDWPVEKNEPNAKTLEGSDETGYANMSSYVNSQYDPLNDNKARSWDSDAQVPFYSWFDKDHKVWRQAYYEDVRSLGLKYDFIKEKNLRGVGIWVLGYDGSYPELWDLLEEKFTKP